MPEATGLAQLPPHDQELADLAARCGRRDRNAPALGAKTNPARHVRLGHETLTIPTPEFATSTSSEIAIATRLTSERLGVIEKNSKAMR